MPGREPTRFPELNSVLAALVEGARGVLGTNFVGAYLQGSFALGDGDEFSDVDFIIVTHEDVFADELARLNVMHEALHARPEVWAQHLEGSYAPAAVLRTMADAPREVPGAPRPSDWVDPQCSGRRADAYPFLYLNNGDRTLARSEHGNTQVVRWVLRERGIILAGPEPRRLVDPVAPDELRAEVRKTMRSFGGALLDGTERIRALWMQGFTVLVFTRMLHALATGEIHSKPASVSWARAHLDPRWMQLIERGWTQRSRYPRGHGAPAAHAALRPDAADVALTLEFVRHALDITRIPTPR